MAVVRTKYRPRVPGTAKLPYQSEGRVCRGPSFVAPSFGKRTKVCPLPRSYTHADTNTVDGGEDPGPVQPTETTVPRR